MGRLYLSPPDVGPRERALLLDAFDSNWIAPLGPHVDAFEREIAQYAGVNHAVALSSGTAALHLAMLLLDIREGDEVLVSSLTFVASANAVTYVGATPVFVDSEWPTWNIDPALVAEELTTRAGNNRLPAAVLAVDIYGQCADYERLRSVCETYGVPLIEDAAEALGATYRGAAAGSFGDIGVFSFNGNKIITTSSGGMLVTNRLDYAERARYLATQAREDVSHYEHCSVGFNYRMSNLLAAVGRGQFESLEAKIGRRRDIYSKYRELLGGLEGISFMPETPFSRSTRWLTVALIDGAKFGAHRDHILKALANADIEARPAWKPMHQQPAFEDCRRVGAAVADTIFESGICLPSGTQMSDLDIERVAEVMHSIHSGNTR